VLRALQVDAVASVALWLDESGAGPQKVVVRITRRENWGVGEAVVGKAGFAGAMGAATAMALKDTERRHQVTLRIEAEPDNARVEVDHRRVGLAPAQAEVLPGKRIVTVSARGYVTESDFVDIPEVTSEVVVHRVKLSRDTEDRPVASAVRNADGYTADPGLDLDARGDASPSGNAGVWNYLVGGALIAAAIPLTVFPLVTAAKQDDCYEQDRWGRCSRYDFGAQSSLMLAGGLFALAGGIAVLVVQPIAGPDSERRDTERRDTGRRGTEQQEAMRNRISLALEASALCARLRGEF
jgi:hypothetical protein